ncbi:hypothetical protein [Acinetobacter sp. YH12126]|uniref:hypothetical protein n=1 Tax=Acinetobacter sp. YH12126 TaxID=2601111 RepID=UPI0015D44006|nr:hypothetical protein [Acinetobacter sp. YH12126]
MKPTSMETAHSSDYLSGNFGSNFGGKNTAASIKGITKKLGKEYQNATVVVFNKATLIPIAVRNPDQNYKYEVLGLNSDITCFIVAFDQNQQFNAVIQDNVVPK